MKIGFTHRHILQFIVLLVFFINGISSLSVKGQNIDIHSFDLKSQSTIMMGYADSLAGFDYSHSYDYCTQEISKIDFYEKPDVYCGLLYKAGIASFHLGLIQKADSIKTQLLALPERNLHPIVKAQLLYLKARTANFSKEYVNAVKYAKESLHIYEQNNDVKGVAQISILLASIYISLDREDLCLEYIHHSLEFIKESSYDTEYLETLLLAVDLKIRMQMLKGAQDYLSIANELSKAQNDNSYKGSYNYMMGQFYYSQLLYDKASYYLDASIEYYINDNNIQRASNVTTWKAAIAMRLKQYDKAIQMNRNALNMRKRFNSYYLQASSQLNMANAFIYSQQYDSALYYIDQGEQIFKRYHNRSDYMRGIELKQSLYLSKRDFKNAFHALEKKMRIQDSLFSVGNVDIIEELESKFILDQYEKKKEEMQMEARLQQIKKNRNDIVLNFVLVVFFLVLLSSSLLFVHFRNKNRRNVIVATQKLIFIQMNSHFVFNALTAIQSLIYKKQIESAIHYLTVFSSLINKIIAVTHKKFISLQTEMSFVMEFLQIQKLRFGDDLKFQINIDDNLEMEQIQLPPMLSYPFIEYAVEECVQKSGADGMLIINVKDEGKYINYQIIDVNLGFIDMDKCFIKRYGGQEIFCEQLTKERISVYNYFFKSKIIFAEINVTVEGTEYKALQFQIKK